VVAFTTVLTTRDLWFSGAVATVKVRGNGPETSVVSNRSSSYTIFLFLPLTKKLSGVGSREKKGTRVKLFKGERSREKRGNQSSAEKRRKVDREERKSKKKGRERREKTGREKGKRRTRRTNAKEKKKGKLKTGRGTSKATFEIF